MEPAAVVIAADPARGEVLAGLGSCRACHTAEGGELSIAASEEAGGALLRVRDSGIGIPKDRLGDIFVPFVQLPNGPQDSNGGLGVGLSLVKTLVELHGGSVEAISSGPGHGSEFVVRLPLAQAVAEKAPVSAPRAQARNRVSASAPQDPAA